MKNRPLLHNQLLFLCVISLPLLYCSDKSPVDTDLLRQPVCSIFITDTLQESFTTSDTAAWKTSDTQNTGDTVYFAGLINDLPKKGAFHFQWIFGDGDTATNPAARHTYADGGKYTVRLIINDAFDNSIEDSVHLYIRKYPAIPGNLSRVNRTLNSITISWSKTDDALSYEIEKADGTDSTRFVSKGAIDDTTFLDSALGEGKKYWYRVRAVNNDGASNFGDTLPAATCLEPKFTLPKTVQRVIRGNAIVCKILVRADPPCDIDWKRNTSDAPIKSETNVDGTTTYSLVNVNDTGMTKYQVTAKSNYSGIFFNSPSVSVYVVASCTLKDSCIPPTGGRVNRDNDTVCYPIGDTVTLTPSANSRYRFGSWSWDTLLIKDKKPFYDSLNKKHDTLHVPMPESRTITAYFIRQSRLTVKTDGTGSGTFTIAGKKGIDTAWIDTGVAIQLIATATDGSIFSGWKATDSAKIVTPAICTTMIALSNDNATITVVFTKTPLQKKRSVATTNDNGYSTPATAAAVQARFPPTMFRKSKAPLPLRP